MITVDTEWTEGCAYTWYNRLVVKHNGETILEASDSMEPEDVSFSRDLSWVPKIILKAYELGLKDGQSGK